MLAAWASAPRPPFCDPMARPPSSGSKVYEPLPAIERFHRSRAKWRLLIGSNRSGKTLAAAVEFARAVLGLDPHKKYRPQHGLAIVIGLDSDHLAMLWRKLTVPGAFFVVREDGHLRPIRIQGDRIHPEDEARRDQWEPAPPLIQPASIAQISWTDKPRMVPRLVVFKPTNWTALFVSSQGEIKQGEHYDFVWIDEQIRNEQFFWEAVRGLVDLDPNYRSCGVWSATSQKQNPLLWELSQKAAVSDEIDQYTLSIVHNPFIPEEERRHFEEMLPEDERQVRIHGAFALEMWRIYPEFEPNGRHGCEPFPIPDDWTRYLALDPGTTHCATVFGAVPPDGKCLYIYDELLLRNADAYIWAQHIARRPDAKRFECWIMDSRAGRVRSIGQHLQIAHHYMQALAAYGIRPATLGPMAGWVPGCDHPDSRRELVHQYFHNTDNPQSLGPGVKLFRGATPKLVHQIYTAQFDAKNPKRRIHGEFDLLDAFEYLIAAKPAYVRPPDATPVLTPSPVWQWEEWINRISPPAPIQIGTVLYG